MLKRINHPLSKKRARYINPFPCSQTGVLEQESCLYAFRFLINSISWYNNVKLDDLFMRM